MANSFASVHGETTRLVEMTNSSEYRKGLSFSEYTQENLVLIIERGNAEPEGHKTTTLLPYHVHVYRAIIQHS